MKSVAVIAVILLSAFAAGFLFPRRGAPPNIGRADTHALAALEPLSGVAWDFDVSKTRPADYSDAWLKELEALNTAAGAGKMALLGAGLDRGVSGAMRGALDSETANLNDWLDERRAGAQAELDALSSQSAEPETPESVQLRYRLLNLKLQLKVLTRDEISFSKARVDEIEKKLEKLEAQEAERRNALARERMEAYEAAAAGLTAEMEKQYNMKRRALEKELNAAIETLEAETLVKLKTARDETGKTAEEGAAVRRAMLMLLRASAPPARGRRGGSFSEARDEYLLAKMKIKAAEICPGLGISLLLADPVWTSGKIKDYTAMLKP